MLFGGSDLKAQIFLLFGRIFLKLSQITISGLLCSTLWMVHINVLVHLVGGTMTVSGMIFAVS